jgi:aryl-alcohol dehydrogenase-like predicted oxidoreductase
MTFGLQCDEPTSVAILDRAADGGIDFLDSSDAYPLGGDLSTRGVTEEILGRWLRGRRDRFIVATKCFAPTGPAPFDGGNSRKHIMSAVDASLRRLQTDYIDLYQAHRFDHETPLEETLRAFDDLVRQGKVLYIGVSEWRAEEIAAAVRIAGDLGLDRIVSNQPQYNMVWRVIESEVIPESEKEGIGQVVFSPIGQGVLTGKYKPGGEIPAGSRAADDKGGADFIARFLTDELLTRVQELSSVADEAGLSMAQLAVAWTLQNPNVSAAIVGATRPDQVRDNVGASGVRLDAGLMRRIDDILGPEIITDPARTASPPQRS